MTQLCYHLCALFALGLSVVSMCFETPLLWRVCGGSRQDGWVVWSNIGHGFWWVLNDKFGLESGLQGLSKTILDGIHANPWTIWVMSQPEEELISYRCRCWTPLTGLDKKNPGYSGLQINVIQVYFRHSPGIRSRICWAEMHGVPERIPYDCSAFVCLV